jgi:hypothetical protein
VVRECLLRLSLSQFLCHHCSHRCHWSVGGWSKVSWVLGVPGTFTCTYSTCTFVARFFGLRSRWNRSPSCNLFILVRIPHTRTYNNYFLILLFPNPPSTLCTLIFHSLIYPSIKHPTCHIPVKSHSWKQQRLTLLFDGCWETMNTMNIIVWFLLVLCNCTCTDGRVLSSQQLAVGEWNVTLRGGWLFDPSSIFPTETPSSSSQREQRFPKRRPWGSSLDCTCSLCDDGTFYLTPMETSSHKLALRGRWKIFSNPYCITDRFYDQLSMHSYPRQQIQQGISFDTMEVSLHCRLWGRYSRKDKPRRGRLTHGSLAITHSSKRPWWKLPNRSVLASFSAFRSSRESIKEGWEDKKYFGY